MKLLMAFLLLAGFGPDVLAFYPGFRYYKSRFNKQTQKGPNVCGFRWGLKVCCEGWRKNLQNLCLIPVCGGFCGIDGDCMRPNVCACRDGTERYDCNEPASYDYFETNSTDPNQWQNDEPANMTGVDAKISGISRSNLPLREQKAFCYLSHERGLCQGQVGHDSIYGHDSAYSNSFKMNAFECCNTVGKAWGDERCDSCETLMKNNLLCKKGMRPNANGTCEDIDECSLGICRNGVCVNFEGSYSCNCPYRMFFNESTLFCDYKKTICELKGKSCEPNGYCIEKDGGKDYRCVCKEDYEPSSDFHQCVKKAISLNLCSVYKDRVCNNGRCVARGANYECYCNDGFRSSFDRKTCIAEINMCTLHKGKLCRNGMCVPIGHNYSCRCNPGYRLSHNLKNCVEM